MTAYFPNLVPVLTQWRDRLLRPGGWLAMVEVVYDDARSAGGYDFEGGRKLADTARAAGLQVVHEGVLVDDELSFGRVARGDVLAAWSARFARMGGLKAFMGDRFSDFEQAFMDALHSESHRSRSRVIFVVAKR